MKYKVVFKPTAIKDLRRLPVNIQKRIGKKLEFFFKQNEPLDYAVPLIGNSKVGDYRFRVGDYRVVFDLNKNKIIILMI
ncbi:MAG TPA: type II toxin-antitoxin system RelE/ParE family toxin, partial [Patescibacteria group bacterium]|nr:type II toxin-antitoxin system RelE/ParE family toxin [Patescibacteria group bacterium]